MCGAACCLLLMMSFVAVDVDVVLGYVECLLLVSVLLVVACC